jgi:hypothetical protein
MGEEAKAEVKADKPYIVKQDKYEVGDKVKLVSKRPWTWNCCGVMDKFLGTVVTLTSIFDGDRISFDGIEGWSIRTSAIEGKVVDTVREAHRPAKVGELIKIVDPHSQHFDYKLGDILQVIEIGASGETVFTSADEHHCIHEVEYNVLENYHQSEVAKPDISILDNFTLEEIAKYIIERFGDK